MACIFGAIFTVQGSHGLGRLFPGFVDALRALKELAPHVKIGVASRTNYPELAAQALELFEVGGAKLRSLVDYEEIYPSDKKKHFRM